MTLGAVVATFCLIKEIGKKYPDLDEIAKELIFRYSRVKLFVN